MLEQYLELSVEDPLPHWKVYVGLGANSGQVLKTLRAAAAELARLSSTPVRCSTIWESEPVDCPPGSPPFLNAVLCLTLPAHCSPAAFLHRLQVLEARFGRVRPALRNAPRTLDLDLLCFGWLVYRMPELVLPHPAMSRRRFVLGPLAELAPELIVPGQRRTVGQLLAALPSRPAARSLAIPLLNKG